MREVLGVLACLAEEMRALFDACERAFESSPSDRQRALARTVMKSEDGSMVKSLIECVCV